MKTKHLQARANLLLLLTATIWGFAFAAQRIGAQYLGSLTFNGIRFVLGSLSLVPLILFREQRQKKIPQASSTPQTPQQPHSPGTSATLSAGLVCGLVMFFGANLQQLGIQHTTAGKAGFITGLYIVIVPILGVFFKRRIGLHLWISVAIAAVGMYLLSITESLTIGRGDLLVLIGSFFWAAHILVIDYYAKRIDAIKLACTQFAVCGLLCLIIAVFTETTSLIMVQKALPAILYGGLCSVGIAYTLQVVAQKHTKPVQASLILSMETVFSLVGGILILGETLNARMAVGCILIFAAILLSQWKSGGE